MICYLQVFPSTILHQILTPLIRPFNQPWFHRLDNIWPIVRFTKLDTHFSPSSFYSDLLNYYIYFSILKHHLSNKLQAFCVLTPYILENNTKFSMKNVFSFVNVLGI